MTAGLIDAINPRYSFLRSCVLMAVAPKDTQGIGHVPNLRRKGFTLT